MMSHLNIEQTLTQALGFGVVRHDIEFKKALHFFTSMDPDVQNQRLTMYESLKEEGQGLAQAKWSVLKWLLNEYVLSRLQTAKTFNDQNRSVEALECIELLKGMRRIFKSHDVADFATFVEQAEPLLSKEEAALLFMEHDLNEQSIDQVSKAMQKALGEKKGTLESKDDFQRAFFKHPLIGCLNIKSGAAEINDKVQNDYFELGEYGGLIKTILQLKVSENQEAYQGFITFLIKEDLTRGFQSIMKDKEYKPLYLRVLLNRIKSGDVLTQEDVDQLMKDIREDHTENVKVEKEEGRVVKIKGSTHSLNDYGFYINMKGQKIFFHGHETQTNGVNQSNQQNNTAVIMRSESLDTIGLTVLGRNALENGHWKSWASEFEEETKEMSRMERVFLSGLQFDARNIMSLAISMDSNTKKESQESPTDSRHDRQSKLANSDFLSSNHYVIQGEKEDMTMSLALIHQNIGKKDDELLENKKNAYMHLIGKYNSFFKAIFKTSGSDNEMQVRLIGWPVLDFIKAGLKLERKSGPLFTKEDMDVIRDLTADSEQSLWSRNERIRELRQDIKELLEGHFSDEKRLQRNEKGDDLKALIDCESLRERSQIQAELRVKSQTVNPKNPIKDEIEQIKKGADKCESGGMSDQEETLQFIKKIKAFPFNKCNSEEKELVKNELARAIYWKVCNDVGWEEWREDKANRILDVLHHENDKGFTQHIIKGKDIHVTQSAYSYQNSGIQKVALEIFNNPNVTGLKDVMELMCVLCDWSGSKITLGRHKKTLKNSLKG